MEHYVHDLLELITVHPNWAIALMSLAAFGESFAFLSLVFPGSTLLIAAGALVQNGSLPLVPVIAGAVVGATLGDSVSFWIGRRFGPAIARVWPFSRKPELLLAGIGFFEAHGGKSVFIGRFFGPVRAVIPLAAGLMRMPRGRFWIANLVSALVWAPLLLLAGNVLGEIGERIFGSSDAIIAALCVLILFGVIGAGWALLRATRSEG